jgi:hypothetical protein
LKCVVFFVRLRAIGDKELLAQVQCLCLYCIGIKSVPYRTQEFISVPFILSRVRRCRLPKWIEISSSMA